MASFFKQTWLVLLLAVAFGVSLAAVETSLEGRIEANARAKLERAAYEVVGVSSDSATAEQWPQAPAGQTVLKVRTADGQLLGWAVLARTKKGYSGEVMVMVGLSPDGEQIVGLQVLTGHQETPGLGARIEEPQWRAQFAGKSADTAGRPLEVVKRPPQSDTEIEAITSATISSQAVVGAVNATLAEVQEAIRGQGSGIRD